MRQLITFIQKEFKHIFRDAPTLLILFFLPLAMMFLFGYALTNEIKKSDFGIVNLANDNFSKEFVQKISHSEFFNFKKNFHSQHEIMEAFRKGEIKVAIIIPANFEDDLTHLQHAQLQIIADASDPNYAKTLVNYLDNICNEVIAADNPLGASSAINNSLVSLTLLYNPQMKSSYSMVPAVMGFILTLVCALMTSVSIVREKERGTMELLLASPVKTITIIIAKLSPYFILSCINFITILVVGHFIMKVPINGSLFWITFLSLLYTIVSLSLGLLVSTIAKTQLAALLISGIVFMMPSLILSGMMFPIENMPLILQFISFLTPARWFIGAIRKLLIMGIDVRYILKEIIILIVMAIGLLTISLKKFKQRLE
ncbi:MAG: ABC transporter permease [Bacteroidales bacterium]|jgi:ABC-2 type transport system permease protein|nr:ABC transporter permease [Bacteroidales bacterium]